MFSPWRWSKPNIACRVPVSLDRKENSLQYELSQNEVQIQNQHHAQSTSTRESMHVSEQTWRKLDYDSPPFVLFSKWIGFAVTINVSPEKVKPTVGRRTSCHLYVCPAVLLVIHQKEAKEMLRSLRDTSFYLDCRGNRPRRALSPMFQRKLIVRASHSTTKHSLFCPPDWQIADWENEPNKREILPNLKAAIILYQQPLN